MIAVLKKLRHRASSDRERPRHEFSVGAKDVFDFVAREK